MPDDNVREITAKFNDQVTPGLKLVNKGLKETDEAIQKTGQTTVTVTDKSRVSYERMVRSFERKHEMRGLTEIQKVERDRERLLKSMGEGNDKLKQRINMMADYAVKEIQAAEATKKLAQNVAEAKRQMDEQAAAAKRAADAARNITERAQYRGAGAVERLQMERMQALREARPGATAGQLQTINREFEKLIRNQVKSNELAKQSKLNERLGETSEILGRMANRGLLALAPIAAGIGWLVKTGAELERTNVAFRNLLGSRAAGDAFFQSLVDYSKQSAFGLQEIASAAQRALALGFKPEMAAKVVKASFAIAASMGQTAQMADRITLALGQMQAKQRVSAEEMNQLSEAGVQGWDTLARVAGKKVPEMMKLAEKGMIDANVAVEVLVETSLKKFGQLEKIILTETTWGKFQQLKKEFILLADSFRKTLLPVANTFLDWLKDANTFVTSLLKSFAGWPPEMQKATFTIIGLTAAAVGINKVLSVTLKLIQDIQKLKMAKAAGEGISSLLTNLLGVDKVALRVGGTFGMIGITAATAFAAAAYQLSQAKARMQADIDDFERRKAGKPKEFWAGAEEGEEFISETGMKLTREETQRMYLARKKQIETGARGDEWAEIISRYGTRIVTPEKPDPAKLKAAAEKRERERQAQIEAATRLQEQANAKELKGIAKIDEEYAKHFREMVGNVEAMVKTWDAYHQAVRAMQIKTIEDSIRGGRKQLREHQTVIDEQTQKAAEAREKKWKADQEYEQKTYELHQENFRRMHEMDIEGIERRRDLQVRTLQAEHAQRVAVPGLKPEQILAEKISFEKRSAEIEIEAARKVHEQKMGMLERELETRILMLEAEFRGSALQAEDADRFLDRLDALQTAHAHARQTLANETNDNIEKRRLETTIKVNDMIADDYRRRFDHIKQQASSLLDQMLSRTQSWGDAMKSIIKAAILTPLKEAAASWIAAMWTGGAGPAGGPGGGGGGGPRGGGGSWWQRLGGIFGMGMPGQSWPPGTTPPIIPWGQGTPIQQGGGGVPLSIPNWVYGVGKMPMSGSGTTAAAAAGGGGGWRSLLPFGLGGGGKGGPLGMLRSLGNLGYGPKGGDFGGEVAGSYKGVGGAAGGAMLLGGATLAMMGLQRGGWSGLGMTAAGGALIGAKFGGPLGAAIGGAIGLGAGFIRMMFKGAEQKVIDQVKKVYGISIDKRLARQIAETAKQQYGGDISMAVYSPQTRELVQLYAMSTGQRVGAGSVPRQMHGVTLAQSGGGVSVQPVYQGGSIVANPYTGLTESQGWQPQPNTFIQLNPEQANTLLEGRVVKIIESNPAAVSNANTSATQAGTNRNAGRAAVNEPLTTIA